MAKLLVQESSGAREFELVDSEVHIGRELDNALRLADPSISRHHCVVRRTASGYEVQDLQSSNGVLVNGERVQGAVSLADGDHLTLGQIQLTFMDPSEAAPSPLGTVRMDPSEMAKIQGISAPPPVAPPVQVPPESQVTSIAPPRHVDPLALSGAPELNPAPAFLQPWLPALPDAAQPLAGPDGEPLRGEFLPRLLAGLIDYAPMLLLALLSIAVNVLAASTSLGGPRAVGFGAAAGIGCLFAALQLLMGVAYLLFIPWCWMKFGATPGKKMMKLRVVPEASPAGRLDLGGAVLRMVGYLVNGVIGVILSLILNGILGLALGFSGAFALAMVITPVVGFLCALVPYGLLLLPERKGLHDMIAKSLVIRVDR